MKILISLILSLMVLQSYCSYLGNAQFPQHPQANQYLQYPLPNPNNPWPIHENRLNFCECSAEIGALQKTILMQNQNLNVLSNQIRQNSAKFSVLDRINSRLEAIESSLNNVNRKLQEIDDESSTINNFDVRFSKASGQ